MTQKNSQSEEKIDFKKFTGNPSLDDTAKSNTSGIDQPLEQALRVTKASRNHTINN